MVTLAFALGADSLAAIATFFTKDLVPWAIWRRPLIDVADRLRIIILVIFIIAVEVFVFIAPEADQLTDPLLLFL